MAISLKQAKQNNQVYKQKTKLKIGIDKAKGIDKTVFQCLKHDFRSINTTKCYECGVEENDKKI